MFHPHASNHSLSSSYPELNFGWNQLLDGLISLSTLYPNLESAEKLCARVQGGGRSRPRGNIVPRRRVPVFLSAERKTYSEGEGCQVSSRPRGKLSAKVKRARFPLGREET